jgi:hypothetical protein
MRAVFRCLFRRLNDALGGAGNPFTSVDNWPVSTGGGSRALNGSGLAVTFAASSTAASRAFTVTKPGTAFISYRLTGLTGGLNGQGRILVSNGAAADAGRLVGPSRSTDGAFTETVALPAGTYYLDLNKQDAGVCTYHEVKVVMRPQ